MSEDCDLCGGWGMRTSEWAGMRVYGECERCQGSGSKPQRVAKKRKPSRELPE